MAKGNVNIQLFVETFTTKREARVRTSDGELQFLDPTSGQLTGNGKPAQWLNLPEGTTVNLVCLTTKPDQATVLLEVPGQEKVGTILRSSGWKTLQAAQTPGEKPATEKEEAKPKRARSSKKKAEAPSTQAEAVTSEAPTTEGEQTDMNNPKNLE